VYHVPNLVSLGIIVGTLAGGVLASVLATRREARQALEDPPGDR